MEKELHIGVILKPQGIKGEMKYKPYFFDEKILNSSKNVRVGNQIFEIQHNVVRQNFGYLKLKEVNSIEEAEKLRNHKIYIDKDKADRMLDVRSFFVEDLIGCNAIDENEKLIGKIIAIYQYGGPDIFEIQETNGKIFQFCFVDNIVIHVNISKKNIILCKNEYEIFKV